MKMKRVIVAFIVVASFSVTLCLIDSLSNTPPSVDRITRSFTQNRDMIDTAARQMINLGFSDIYIPRNDGYMQADLSTLEIEDEPFLSAINQLLGIGPYIHIGKDGNTIWLLQWTGIRDIGCGIAYSIDGITLPHVEYCTELIPVSDDGWYYYVSDYNLWRSSHGANVLNPN